MFHSTPRTRRHRNPPATEEQQQQPFFSKAGHQPVQAKAEPFFQAKLTVGQPGDQYEQEADAVANKVVNQPSAGGQPAVQKQEISTVQRLATPDEQKMPGTNDERMAEDKAIQEKEEAAPKQEEEKPVQKMEAPKKEEEKPVQKMDAPKKEEEKEPPVQTKSNGQGTAQPANLSSRLSQRQGKGEPLPRSVRSQMEQGIWADFGGVRIHKDSEAVGMNKDLHAQAFTHGQDIYFNAGKFNPEQVEGKRLLAHELTHVVQQGGGAKKEKPQLQKQDMDAGARDAAPVAGTEAPMPEQPDAGVPAPREDMDAGVPTTSAEPMDAGSPQAEPRDAGPVAGVPDSALATELRQIWSTGDKGVFFERLRNLTQAERSDGSLHAFVSTTLKGDDLWLAQNILQYGRETNWPIELRLEREFKGWGDSGGLSAALTLFGGATDAQRTTILGNAGLIAKIRTALTFANVELLRTNITNAAARQALAHAIVETVKAGVVRTAAEELLISAEAVDRNTAVRILNGSIIPMYFSELSQPADVNARLTALGFSTTDFTIYYSPVDRSEMIVQRNAQGTQVGNYIIGDSALSTARWREILVHETGHAINPQTNDDTPEHALDRYRSEFRAYWVAEFRGVADLDERARQIRAHILSAYPRLNGYYTANADFKTAVDAHTRPDGNVLNN